jgi:hypothetical protein
MIPAPISSIVLPLPLPAEVLQQKKPPLMSWRTWIVPAIFLRDFIYEHKHIWQYRFTSPQKEYAWHGASVAADDCGWRTQISLEVAETTGQTMETAQRHLYRVLSGESHCIQAEFAEAVVMSLNMHIDLDTTIPVFPGNLRCAEELLEVRDPHFWERPREERLHFQREVMELCIEIIQHPERLEELQDAAPFNCLRPPVASIVPVSW